MKRQKLKCTNTYDELCNTVAIFKHWLLTVCTARTLFRGMGCYGTLGLMRRREHTDMKSNSEHAPWRRHALEQPRIMTDAPRFVTSETGKHACQWPISAASICDQAEATPLCRKGTPSESCFLTVAEIGSHNPCAHLSLRIKPMLPYLNHMS